MSKVGIIAGTLWAGVAGLMLSGWIVVLVTGHEAWHIAGMLAASACALSALAATIHIKIYACRISRLIRVTGGLERDDGCGSSVELRPLR